MGRRRHWLSRLTGAEHVYCVRRKTSFTRRNQMSVQQSATKPPGHLDPLFGVNGRAVLEKPNPDDIMFRPASLAVDSAGRYCVAGEVLRIDRHYDVFCARFTPNGHIDTTFGTNGYMTIRFTKDTMPLDTIMAQVSVLDDGKLFLTGDSFGVEDKFKALARLHPNGELDTSFGSRGTAIVSTLISGARAETVFEHVHSLANDQSGKSGTVLPDGKILLHDQSTVADFNTQSCVVRLLAPGDLDTSFNQTGKVLINHPDFKSTRVIDVLHTQQGMYAIAGTVEDEITSYVFLSQLLPTGALDTSFGKDGYTIIDLGSAASLYQMVQQTNRRLLVVGSTNSNGVLISREPDGSENIQFNRGKPLLTQLNASPTQWRSAFIRPDGKIIVYGLIERLGIASHVVALFTDEGVLDTTFGSNNGWSMFTERWNVWTSAVFIPDKVAFLDQWVYPCVTRGLLT
ncbi:hypothetical protein GIW70_07625 [Pseudomonas syringae]|nr:hypothetical protein [Pseudomonas syringae]MCF5068065.1 hypothetical protein [Pseudomonas syringae]